MKATKAQERRDRIVSIAKEVFCEYGYEGASMSIIAARVGGSKGTLYNYFPSKDELLLATMLAGAESFQRGFTGIIDAKRPLEEVLYTFVNRILQLLYQDVNTVKLLRVVISVGGTTDVGKRFFEYIGEGVWTQVEQFLELHIQAGNLREKSPHYMAKNLRGLCDADILRMLMGAMPNMSDDELNERSHQVVTSFLTAYRSTDSDSMPR